MAVTVRNPQRIYWLDCVRIIACMLVVLIHSLNQVPYLTPPYNYIWVVGEYLLTPCVPLFFMVSGALVMPTELPMRQFLKHRVGRILWPLIVWSIVYIIILDDSNNAGDMIKYMLSIPFTFQGTGDLWFIYAIVSFYLIVPIISPWLRQVSVSDCRFYMLLIVIAFSFGILCRYFNIHSLDFVNVLYYFCCPAAFCFVGWYMVRYSAHSTWKGVLLLWLFSVASLLLVRAIDGPLKPREILDLMTYNSLPSLGLTILYFKIIQSMAPVFQKMGDKAKSLLVLLSNLSFGVYLCHRLVLACIEWYVPSVVGIINPVVKTFVLFSTTIVLSFTMVYLLSRLPLSRYYIGTHYIRRTLNHKS